MARYVNNPPAADKRVTELHCWIGAHDDGGEGIMSTDMDLGDGIGLRHIPLMTSNRAVAEEMRPNVERMLGEARAQGAKMVTAYLVTFRRVDE
jgi:hypothetical protein